MQTATTTESPYAVLRRVGIVLIVVGVLDIAWMFHAISSRQGYSSSFNIFAVIAGVLLYRQSLLATRIVTLFSAVFIAGFLVILITLPLFFPVGLLRTYFRITPMASLVGSGAFIAAALAILLWVYRSLASSPVQAAIRSAGFDDRRFLHRPRSGFWLGAALATVLATVLFFVERSETAQEAIKRARAAKGPGFHYFVSSLSRSWTSQTRTDVQATVLAYTDSTVEAVNLEWHE